ncbi:fimbrial protein [Lysobacter panacisoli]|nr:fimbrial protein [Lysobacter panacisoli]
MGTASLLPPEFRPAGELLIEQKTPFPIGSKLIFLTCPDNVGGSYEWQIAADLALGEPVPGLSGVYRTGVPGVGYRMTLRIDTTSHASPSFASANVLNTQTVPLGSQTVVVPVGGGSGMFPNDYLKIDPVLILEFVSTGEVIKDGTFQIPEVLLSIRDTGGASILTHRFQGGRHTITIPRPTCSVTPSKTVIMPTISPSASAVGTPVGSIVDFDMQLTGCTNVAEFSSYQVAYRIDPAPGVSKIAGAGTGGGDVLTLGSGSTASGVGIQIFEGVTEGPGSVYTTQAIPFGVPLRANNVNYGLPGLPTYTLPFRAQYVATSPNITAGNVSTQAVISITYD